MDLVAVVTQAKLRRGAKPVFSHIPPSPKAVITRAVPPQASVIYLRLRKIRKGSKCKKNEITLLTAGNPQSCVDITENKMKFLLRV